MQSAAAPVASAGETILAVPRQTSTGSASPNAEAPSAGKGASGSRGKSPHEATKTQTKTKTRRLIEMPPRRRARREASAPRRRTTRSARTNSISARRARKQGGLQRGVHAEVDAPMPPEAHAEAGGDPVARRVGVAREAALGRDGGRQKGVSDARRPANRLVFVRRAGRRVCLFREAHSRPTRGARTSRNLGKTKETSLRPGDVPSATSSETSATGGGAAPYPCHSSAAKSDKPQARRKRPPNENLAGSQPLDPRTETRVAPLSGFSASAMRTSLSTETPTASAPRNEAPSEARPSETKSPRIGATR